MGQSCLSAAIGPIAPNVRSRSGTATSLRAVWAVVVISPAVNCPGGIPDVRSGDRIGHTNREDGSMGSFAQKYADEMRKEHGRSCEFLTVAETAPDWFGFDLTQEQLEKLHDTIVED